MSKLVNAGIVGRYVTCRNVWHGGKTMDESYEVMACQAVGESGNWFLLVASRDGELIDVAYSNCTLVANEGV